jgi:hypothetical protein
MKKTMLLISSVLLFLSCGSGKYLTSSYERLAPGHDVIAILPYQNIYTGRTPKDISNEAFRKLLEEDAYYFQQSLYGQLLEESGIKKGQVRIDIQDIITTNRLLKAEGLKVEDIGAMDASTLAELLNVNAVVRVNIRKRFLLTTEESIVVDLAGTIYRRVIRGPMRWITWDISKTGELFINASIIDGKEDIAIWNLSREADTDWKRPMDEVVRDINHFISKKFPYREVY